ncbi:MAG: RNA polymerase sigma factor FliA [Hydrogenophilaceae bacterium]|nr:RNA polymerase sigma factor FliA [Hydrogenophilaceae bacterium]
MPGSTAATDKDALVRQYAPLVKRIAYHLMARLPASVEVDDLIQAGLIGLLNSVDRYDDAQGANFETYASRRIRGAMLDELRDADWASRSVRKSGRQIELAIHALQQRLGKQPSEQEIADELQVELKTYYDLLNDARGAQLVYYEDLHDFESDEFLARFADEAAPAPFDLLAGERFRQALVQAIGVLPEREKMLMAMYYDQELNFKEIGAVMGVSESRVCQLHTQAVSRLRSWLKDWAQSSE